ncbi:hypothetical protein Q8A67_024273 [Cirrhinus molitorella]|uniref:Uncharacterized protein n=1 Tax=Cirrhinus molitorella TaxID=172907 RepID=A0AA88T9B5_9TELE|nr:hypothetical protein Q8A67_024273 [Cirrhinus molitorella]
MAHPVSAENPNRVNYLRWQISNTNLAANHIHTLYLHSLVKGVFTGIIHALRIKSRPPIAPLLNTRHPITANGMSAACATGVMVGHPRFQECEESGIKRRTSVSAGPRGPETEDARGYKLCIGPQCTATESESTAKRIQAPVWITERKESRDAGQRPSTDWMI